jgi:hypothetical protein
LYRIFQLAVYFFRSFTPTPTRSVDDVAFQDIMPSGTTLQMRSTRDQRGNCSPIFATVR